MQPCGGGCYQLTRQIERDWWSLPAKRLERPRREVSGWGVQVLGLELGLEQAGGGMRVIYITTA